ncbi:MAG: translocation/assembly module TamB [Chlorobi bacterium]|nr:translocation/assembly module TamB [Chlorobiota bacterium]
MQKRVFQTDKLRRFTLYGIITLLILLLSLIIMLQTAYIQTKITNYITKELSEKLKTDIHIDNVNISLFKGFKIQGILIKDLNRDTMLYIKDLYILPSGIPTNFNKLSFRSVELDELYFNLYEVKKDTLNLDYIIDAMIPKNDTSKTEDFHLRTANLTIHNSVFKYKEIDSITNDGMDFEDMQFSDIEVNINDVDIFNSTIQTVIKNISLKEKSGLIVKNISTKKNFISPTKILIKDLDIQTDKSHLQFDSLNLSYPDRYYFSPYKTDLYVEASFKKSSAVNYQDIALFLQDSIMQNGNIFIAGNIKGKLNNLYLSGFSLNAENVFSLKTTSHIKNFPDWKNLAFDINISELKANFEQLSHFSLPGKNKPLIKVPVELQKIKSVSYIGKTKGNSSDFTSKGILSGDFGKITIDASAQKDTDSFTTITGNLTGKNIDIGRALDNSIFGKLSFEQNFNLIYLKNKKININTSGIISQFNFKNHTYHNINLFASVNDKILDSLNISINQPELVADLSGFGDFSENIPKLNIFTDILHADLQAMKFKTMPSSLQTEIVGNFKGLNIDDFEGTVKLKKPLIYTEENINTVITNLLLKSKYTVKDSVKSKQISLTSDIVDVYLKSTGNISNSFKSLKLVFDNIFDEPITEKKPETISANDFLDFSINIKKPNVLTQLFLPDFEITAQSKVFGYFQPYTEKFNLSFNAKELKYKSSSIKDFYFITYTHNNKLYAGLGGSSVKPNKNFYLENLNLGGEIKKDNVNFNLIWNNFKDSANYAADISGTVVIHKKENNKYRYKCTFSNSELTLNDILWKFDNAAVNIDSSHINISDFRIIHNNEEVYIDGNISKYQGDILYAKFKNLNISNFKPLISDDIKLTGKLSGFSTFAGLYSSPLVFTKDSIIDLNINNMNLGNFYLKSFWDDAKNSVHVNAYNRKGKRKFMNDTIYGDYNPDNKTLNFTVDVRSMLLKTFRDYYVDFVDFNPSAFLAGKINIKGKINNPDITGNFKIKQTTAYIRYLNTFNNIDELQFRFNRKNIIINKTKMTAKNGKGTAFISGIIHHNNFKKFALDIDAQVNNYDILDIIRTDSSYYYGQAYASGNINFSGPLDDIFLDANLTTEKNTIVYIPISSDKTYNEENSFLTFKTDTAIIHKSKPSVNITQNTGGFSMNLKLDVTPDADIEILPDESSGDIQTVGNGGISLILDKKGDFNVYGTYNISKGHYQFNLQNIIRTDFVITENSTIDWFGAPEDATVNINAAYMLNNVSLSDLTQDPNEVRRTNVQCVINITGKLLNPKFKLNIILPENLNEYSSKLNNLAENELNQQFLSLLLIGVFQPLPGIKQENIAGNQVTGEILSKQLNGLLKSIKYVDLNFDYKSGNENISNEYKLGLSKKFLNDRIEIKGNLGIGGQETQQSDAANYIGEFELQAKLNKKGTIRAKVYNKANDKIENDGDYTQGLGFIWRRDFDYLFRFNRKQKPDTVKIPERNDSIK